MSKLGEIIAIELADKLHALGGVGRIKASRADAIRLDGEWVVVRTKTAEVSIPVSRCTIIRAIVPEPVAAAQATAPVPAPASAAAPKAKAE